MGKLFGRQLSRRTFLGGAVAAAGMGLTACGNNNNNNASNTSDVKGEAGGGIITAGAAYSTQNYDPSSTSSALALGVNWQVSEGLYGMNYHDYHVFNELATADPQKVDDTTFEVSIRKDAKFSDGTAVSADDVVESFKRATAEGNIYVSMLAPIASVEKKDDATVTIKTNVPNFSLLKERLSIVRVVPAKSAQDDMKKMPVGSGPWMYKTISDNSLDLEPNPNYNGVTPAKDKALHYDILKDPTARLTAQTDGTTLAMEMVPADAIDQLKNAGCTVDTVQGFGVRFLMYNLSKAPWDNVKVRQAVMYALDTDKMIANALAGQAEAATCYLPSSFSNYHKAATVYTHDEEKAKSLIKDSGITPGEVVLRTTDNEQVKNMATEVKQNLDALGFTVSIQTDTSPATYSAIDAADGSWDMLLAPGDPSCFGGDTDLLLNWWYGDNIWMKTRCPWKETDEWKKLHELMDKALTQSGADQQSTWNECFDLLAENVPLYPVLFAKTSTASWSEKPNGNGVALQGFKGIGTTGMSFVDVNTVTQK